MSMVIGLVDYDLLVDLCLTITVRLWVNEPHQKVRKILKEKLFLSQFSQVLGKKWET